VQRVQPARRTDGDADRLVGRRARDRPHRVGQRAALAPGETGDTPAVGLVGVQAGDEVAILDPGGPGRRLRAARPTPRAPSVGAADQAQGDRLAVGG
jgi:hypothetical protein